MPISSAEVLVTVLQKFQFLEPGQLQHLEREALNQGDAPTLTTWLLEKGWLTPFQANLLLQGRGEQLVLGPYLVMDRLGEGGTGQVFRAKHQKMRRIVALKIIRRELLADPEVVTRFYREIEITSQVAHPNLVHAYDAGPIGDLHFLSMEYIKGIDLARLVKSSGPLAVDQACDYVRQAAQGLQHIHEHGLIHRDIKPSNLLVAHWPGGSQERLPLMPSDSTPVDLSATPWGVIKILDLGLARFQQPIHGELTGTFTPVGGTTMGTPDYMAPEQALNFHRADIRSDLYSLGCTLFHLLTGQPPFAGGALAQKLLAHQQTPPPAIGSLRPDVPAPVVQVVERLLEKQPSERFQLPAQLADALSGSPQWGTLSERPSSVTVPTAIPPSAFPVAVVVPSTPGSSEALPTAIPLVEAADPSRTIVGAEGEWAPNRLSHLVEEPVSVTWVQSATPLDSAAVTVAWTKLPPISAASEVFPLSEQRRLPAGWLWIFGISSTAAMLVICLGLGWLLGGWGIGAPLDREPADSAAANTIPPEERYDWQPKELVGVLGNHRFRHWGGLSSVSYSSDSPQLITYGSDQFVRIWDPQNGRERTHHRVDKNWGAPLVVAPDGKAVLACSLDQVIRLWDATTGKELMTYQGHQQQPTLLGFGPDRKTIYSSSRDGTIRLWDKATGRELALIKRDQPFFTGPVAVSANGTTVAWTSNSFSIHLWDVTAGRNRATLALPKTSVSALTFTPNSAVCVAATSDRNLRTWDAASGRELAHWTGHAQQTFTLAVSPDSGTLATSSYDGVIKLWDLTQNGKELGTLTTQGGAVSGLSFAPDGKTVASGSADGTARLWDVAALKETQPSQAQATTIRWLTYAPDGKTIATSAGDHQLRLWDLSTGREQLTIVTGAPGSNEAAIVGMTSAGFAGAAVATAHRDGAIRFWNTTSGKEQRPPLAVSDGKFLDNLACTRDGKVLATSLPDGTIKLLDSSSERELASLKGHRGRVSSLAFSFDDKILVSSGSDGSIRLWEVATAKPQIAFPTARQAVVAASPDGKSLAWGGGEDRGIHLWDANQQKERALLPGHFARITGVAYAPEGNWFVSVDADGRIIVWDVMAQSKIHEYQLPGAVQAVVCAPDNRHFATANRNGTVYIYRVQMPDATTSSR